MDDVLRWVQRFAADPDDADDLVQKAWTRAWERRASYTARGSFRGWLYQVARSACLDHVRARRHSASEGGAGAPATLDARASPDPSQLHDRARQFARVRQAVADLPPRQRQVVSLRLLDGFDTRETAELMGCAEGTVKASLSHALANLRTRLDPHDEPEEER